MSAVAELEDSLRAMLALKPPGVSGSKINSITALCIANVQSESVIIQKLFMHFKKTPPTHKLGVLYVVDNVTRKWLDQAKLQGQTISSTAPDGTFAAGVHRVTELMPILMNDIIATAPEDQKDKIKKLLDIWDKGQTFPAPMVALFKEKINAPRPAESTTPPGSPPPNLLSSLQGASSNPSTTGTAPLATAIQGMPNIMEALANIARQNTTAAQANAGLAATAPPFTAPSSGLVQPAPVSIPSQPQLPYLGMTQSLQPPVNVTAPAYSLPAPPPSTYAPVPAQGLPLQGGMSAGGSSIPSVFPPGPQAPAGAQQLALITTLVSQGIPPDQVTKIVQQVMANAPPGGVPGPAAQLGQPGGYPTSGAAAWDAGRDLHDRNGRDPMRSPRQSRGRSRSRSPRGWDSRDSPRSRGNDHGLESGRVGRPDDRDRGRGGRGSDYRQRSPAGRRDQSPPGQELQEGPRWIEYDPSLPSGSIKVLSRTLFVGGVTCSEAELRHQFSQFGQVQTCIVNKEKRHAFVKMYYRRDAERAKVAMDEPRNSQLQLRTRWGVGFGPRDCSDYQTGISVIPIHKLTEADRKWMLTAPFGGSGGRPIESGLCVEEPDIEIGAGVSSKAISRRMQTDKSGHHGPKSTRREDDNNLGAGHGPAGGGGGNRWRRGGRDNRNGNGGERQKNEVDDEPVIAGLPPGFTMGPNGINVPAGFSLGTS
ncbi:hypothetical protein GQ53DRAFT_654439 [Thozetella sp. PMI_491]|nr:hypothetical protein GQ53DRAFT_654439 [Thozetella sp. PMI_491]